METIRYGRSEGLRVLGHPAHALLVHLPLGLWVAAAVWDVLALAGVGAGGGEVFWRVSFWTLVAGLVAAVPTAATGFLDYLGLVERRGGESPAAGVATYHLAANLTAATAYGASLLARGGPVPAGGGRLVAALALAGAGLVLLAVGGWLGAELVYRHGVGTASGADPGGAGREESR